MSATRSSRPAGCTRRQSLAWLGALPWTAGAATRASSALEVRHVFSGGLDGGHPGGLLSHSNGEIYGVAHAGGRHGRGVIYRLGAAGVRVLHHFGPHEARANVLAEPLGPLLEGPEGELLGVVFDGGRFGRGLLYRLDLDGRFTALHHFNPEGKDVLIQPHEQPTLGPDGALYGSCDRVRHRNEYRNAVYRLAPDGHIAPFGPLDGFGNGLSRLTLAHDAFYAQSYHGGGSGRGALLRLSPAGELTAVYSAEWPSAPLDFSGGLTLCADGSLWGTGENDASDQRMGCLYRLRSDGKLAFRHVFDGPAEGAKPFGLLDGPGGRLFGVASQWGPGNNGTVYAFDPRDRLCRVLHAFDDFVVPHDRLVQGAGRQVLGVTRYAAGGQPGMVYALAV